MLGIFSKKSKNSHPIGTPEQAERIIGAIDATDPCRFLDDMIGWAESLSDDNSADVISKAEVFALLEDKSETHLSRIERGISSGARIPKSLEERYKNVAAKYIETMLMAWTKNVDQNKKLNWAYVHANVRVMSLLRRKHLWESFSYNTPVRDLLMHVGKIYQEACKHEWEDTENTPTEHIPAGCAISELILLISASLSSYGGLSPHQIYLAEKIIHLLHRDFSFRLTKNTSSTFFFSVSSKEKPSRITPDKLSFPQDTVYLDMHDARPIMETWIRSCDDGFVPPSIQEICMDATPGAVSFVLKHLMGQWFFDASARKYQRIKTAVRLDVIGGMQRIFETFGKTSPADAEIWTCHNISIGGFAATLDKRAGDWIRIGAPISVHIPNKPDNEWGIGVIRRMSRKESGETEVGVEIFSLNAKRGDLVDSLGGREECLVIQDDKQPDTYRLLTRNTLFSKGEMSSLHLDGKENFLFASEIVELWSGFQVVEYSKAKTLSHVEA